MTMVTGGDHGDRWGLRLGRSVGNVIQGDKNYMLFISSGTFSSCTGGAWGSEKKHCNITKHAADILLHPADIQTLTSTHFESFLWVASLSKAL